MPFNIQAFKDNFLKEGYLQNNKYELIVTPPRTIINSTLNNNNNENVNLNRISRMIAFRAEAVRAPGLALISIDNARYGVGPVQKYPVTASFNEIGVSIICDKNSFIWQFWYNWLKTIFNFSITEDATSGAVNRIATYDAKYKDDYSTDILIGIFDLEGNLTQQIKLYEAFPTTMKDIDLSWSATNELIRIDIMITFREFSIISSTLNYPVEESQMIGMNSSQLSTTTNLS